MSNRDWVTQRAACSVETALASLLEIVRHNVEQANALDAGIREHHTFEILGGTGRFTVKTVRESQGDFRDQRFVSFEQRDEGILVFSAVLNNPHKPVPTPEFLIVPSWNAENGRCELLIGGEPHKLWQISQRALAGLFSLSWREPETNL